MSGVWMIRIECLLAFSCLNSFTSCLTSPQCHQYIDNTGKVGMNCSHRSHGSVPPSLPTTIEILLLSFNSITSVSLSSFKNLSKLHDLDLSNNQIKHLEADYPLSVEKVDLSSNALNTIPDFRNLPNLRKLTFDHNEIAVLPERAFEHLVNLVELSIKGNTIVDIPDYIFDPLQNLQFLTLSANKIEEFPKGALDAMGSLETFDISNNKLTTIPPDFFENNSLLYVLLYNNPWHCECDMVKYLKDWIDENDGNIYKVLGGEADTESVVCATPTIWQGTPIINLSSEQICPIVTTETSPMSTVSEMSTTFSTLLLPTSPPQEVCDVYIDSTGKVGMNCSHRSLESVPPSLPTNIEILLLSFNSITSVSLSSFKNLSKLHDLDFSNNQIKHLEADYPLSVEKVDLSSNALNTIPDFRNLPNLRKLTLDHNEIAVLPERAFEHLVNLVELSIKGNAIIDIPDHIFDPLQNLQYLTLSTNKIEEFPKGALDAMGSLETFDVSNNNLSGIPSDFFGNNSLLYVSLYDNPWRCDCNNQYLAEWIRANKGKVYSREGTLDDTAVLCSSLSEMNGIPLIRVPIRQGCAGTTPVPPPRKSTQAVPSVTNPDESSAVWARRSCLLETLKQLGWNCLLLLILLFLSLCLVLLEISALIFYALRFHRRLYLPLKQLAQQRLNIRLVRYSLVLPNFQQIYPVPSPGTEDSLLEEDGNSIPGSFKDMQ